VYDVSRFVIYCVLCLAMYDVYLGVEPGITGPFAVLDIAPGVWLVSSAQLLFPFLLQVREFEVRHNVAYRCRIGKIYKVRTGKPYKTYTVLRYFDVS